MVKGNAVCSCSDELVDVVIGVDTRKHTHTPRFAANTGAVLVRATVPTDPAGYAELPNLLWRTAASGRGRWKEFARPLASTSRSEAARCIRTTAIRRSVPVGFVAGELSVPLTKPVTPRD
jgi:hypothetical protein